MSFHGNPGQATQKAEQFGPTLRRMLADLRGHTSELVFAIGLSIASVILNVLGPKLLGDATNVVFGGVIGRALPAGQSKAEVIASLETAGKTTQARTLSTAEFTPGQGIDFSALTRALLLVLAVYICAALATWWSARILASVVAAAGYDLRSRLQHKIDRLPLAYLDKQKRGDLLSRGTNDIDNVTQTLQQTISGLVTAILTVLGIAGMMLWVSWRLAILTLLLVPVSAVITMLIVKRSQPHFRAQWKATGELTAVVEDAFSGHEVAKLYSMEKHFNRELALHNEILYESSRKAQFLSSLTMPIMRFLGNFNYALIAIAGGILITWGKMNLGQVQAFIQYSGQFTQPLAQIAQMISLCQSGVASAERLYELLDAPDMPTDAAMSELASANGSQPPREAALLTAVAGHIEFQNVHFSYKPGVPVITGLNLDVKPGMNIAIVGPTGAGKTTLVNLLLRFYEVDSGRILLDGIDIRQIPRAQLRAQMGMVLQETWLFEGTVADNIAFGKRGLSRPEVEDAARAASAHHLVRTLAHGYDTVVAEGSESVSAGEKQLLTIARAYAADPPILILDEATSSVDTRTEVLVQTAMSELAQGRTSFVIAHRLSTIREADLIVVMDRGDVVEQGKHEELLAAGGVYAGLYQSQFSA